MRSLRSTLAYDGTHFFGFQRQPGKRTVQGELERVLSKVAAEPIVVTASGRTDAGVHALGQVVGYRTNCTLPSDVFVRAVNAELPDDISLFDVTPVADNFDPIRDAISKRYRYVLEDSRRPDVFARHYLWHIRKRLNVEAMREAAQTLVGKHDFTSYETTGSSRVTRVRTVLEILVERRPAEFNDRVIVEVEADGFLYNMVRNIVGTLVQVGRGKRPISWPGEALAARDRQAAGMTAPAQGLFLLWVRYE